MPKKLIKAKVPYYVHVASLTLRKNRALVAPDRAPPIIVRKGRTGKSVRAHVVEILGETGAPVAFVEYTPDRPLPCGAVVTVRAVYGARVPAAKAAQSGRAGGSCASG